MNWLGALTLLIGFSLYDLGAGYARKTTSRSGEWLFLVVAIVAAIPAATYAFYYSKLLGDPVTLYRLRTVPGSELLASAAGLIAGWAQVRLAPRMHLSSAGKRFLIPVVLGLAISLPYLKPIFRPLRSENLRDTWKATACLQSTPSTCGPAAAATIARLHGAHVTEAELAREAFTCRSGTENWYLARALRRRGLRTDFLLGQASDVALPAIAGVRLRSLGRSGHFIALLERRGSQFLVADPMDGLSTNSLVELNEPYEFTGFFLWIGTNNSTR